MLKIKFRNESEIHKLIKQKIAEGLIELGYDVETEKIVSEGRIDVYGKKLDNEISVEVMKSHVPNWILLKVKGDIAPKVKEKRTTTTKLMLDCDEDLWDKVKIFKIEKKLNDNNEAVIELIKLGLKK